MTLLLNNPNGLNSNDLNNDTDAAVRDSDIARFFDGLNHTEQIAAGMIERLPDMNDDQVLLARGAARAVGASSWRVECACDAEILRRTHLRGGRGHKDTEGIGVVATLNTVAAEVGVSTRTLRNNAAIYEMLLTDTELVAETAMLDEKQFWTEALKAPEPKSALREMAEQKAGNSFFNTQDARRHVEGKLGKTHGNGADAPKTPPPAAPGVQEKEVQEKDWRRLVEYHLTEALSLLPAGFRPTYVLAIERTKSGVWKYGIDGKEIE